MEMKTVHIGDLGEIKTGNTPSKKNPDNYGDYALWIKPTDINPDEKYTRVVEEMFSEKAAIDCRSRLIPAKSICVPCIGTVGTKLTMTPCDCFVNQSINAIIPNDDYDNDYVYYLLLNFLPNLKSINKGTASGREYIAKSAFENIEIKVHSDIKVQRIIGKILSAYDDMIDNCKNQIALLEEAAQRLYHEWFVDLRFPGHETTPIGENGLPIGWQKLLLSTPFTIKYGKNLSTKFISNDGKIPVYGASGCIGYYHTNNVSGYAVLITSRGNSSGRVHRTYHKNSFVTNNSFIVSPKLDYNYIPLSFIFYSLNNIDLTRFKTGSAQPQLTNASLYKVEYLLPSNSTLKAFGIICDGYLEKIAVLKRIIEQCNYTKSIVLPRLISGQIEINA